MTTELGGDVTMIDTRMGGHPGITASYLIRSGRPCLVETGPATAAPALIQQIGRLGIEPGDLGTIVVTHIHLDHAGGVGHLARAFPNATIAVHERGARHLIEPTRLMASARQVFGAAMDRLVGELLQTPADRLQVIGESGAIDLGDGRVLRAFHSPGHASHHIGLLDSASGDLYTGDAAGVFVPETQDVRPATPPPDFDLDQALASLSILRSTEAERLLFSHFGPVTAVDATLERSADELRRWVADVRDVTMQTPDVDHAIAMVTARDRERRTNLYADADTRAKFDELSSVAANVHGVIHWQRRQSPSR